MPRSLLYDIHEVMNRHLKNQFIYTISRIAIFFLARTPRSWVPILGALIGQAALRLAAHERKTAEKQLVGAYGTLSERRRRLLLRGIAVAVGSSALEAVRLLGRRVDFPVVDLPESSRHAIDSALAEGRGVVFITGHVGNWELMAAWLADRGYPIHTVVRSSYDPRFTRLIETGRRRRGVKTIFRGQSGAARAMLRTLRTGGILGFLIDQDTDVPSVFVPFFGRNAKTPVGPAVFATRCNAPVVIGTIHRRPDNTHRITIERCAVGKDTAATTALFTAALETRIRRHPAQWVWFHRRWRSEATKEAV